jgi:hypothetical protein
LKTTYRFVTYSKGVVRRAAPNVSKRNSGYIKISRIFTYHRKWLVRYKVYSVQARATLTISWTRWFQRVRSWALVCVMRRSNRYLFGVRVSYLVD